MISLSIVNLRDHVSGRKGYKMVEKVESGSEFPDVEKASKQMADFAERSARIVQAFIDRKNTDNNYP